MRMILLILAGWTSVAACAAVVSPTLPAPEWVDCEAATNAALPSATWQKRGHFDVRLSVATGTNLVQVAFGHDVDGNGELSYDETVLVVGRGPEEVFFEDVSERRWYVDAEGLARVEIAPDGTVCIMR